MEEETDRTIVNFLRGFTNKPQGLQKLEDLSTGQYLIEVCTKVHGMELDLSRVVNVETWANSLSNLKLLVRGLEDYNRDQLGQRFDKDQIDLVKVARFRQRTQILELFKAVLGILFQADNKHIFIDKMREMAVDQQKILAELVQSILMVRREPASQPSPDRSLADKQGLLHRIDELESQVASLTAQISQLKIQRQSILKNLNDQTKRVEYLEQETSQLKLSSLDTKMQMMSIIEKEQTNSLVENLKERLVSVSIQHEKQISKYKEQIDMMENSMARISQLEKTNQDLNEQLDEIRNKLHQIAKEKENWANQLKQKDKALESLRDNEKSLMQKISKIEFDNVAMSMEQQKMALRSEELKQTITKITAQPSEGQKNKSFSRSTKLSDLLPDTDKVDRIKQLQKQVEIQTNKNKQLVKQLSKCKIRAQRADKLQVDNRNLQEIALDYSRSRGQEIQILTTALYELRVRYKNMVKKLQDKEKPASVVK